jgi:hypothetical protein
MSNRKERRAGKKADKQQEAKDWLRDYQKHFDGDVLPKMKSSAFVLGILDEGIDLKLVIEMGAALLLDKPLIMIAPARALIPPRVRQIADAIIVTDNITNDPEAQAALNAAMNKTLERLRHERTV